MLKWVLVPKMAESDIVTPLHDAAFLILALPSMYFDTHESASVWTALYPVFVRGKRILPHIKAGKKILDHRGIVLNEPIGALAHFGHTSPLPCADVLITLLFSATRAAVRSNFKERDNDASMV